MANPKEELPKRENEVVNPGDPGPTVLVPDQKGDPRENPKLPPDVTEKKPAPGV